jgi:PBP1b-binding outer membrane lipoprotein LpoB
MKKLMLISVVIFVLALLLASCQGETDDEAAADEATTDYCGNLRDFGTELAEFGQELTQFDTMDEAAGSEEVNQALADVQQAWNEVKATAPEDFDADAAEQAMEESLDDLEQALRNSADAAGGGEMTYREMVEAMAASLDLFNSECNIANFGQPG